jgi:hypothetical protein
LNADPDLKHWLAHCTGTVKILPLPDHHQVRLSRRYD